MVAVILADRYSNQTLEKIISHYKKFGVNNIIVCQTSEKERIEEIEKDEQTIIVAKIGKIENYLAQLLKIKNLIEENDFFLTFGDYFCNIDLKNLFKFHKNSGKVVSIASIKKENYFYNAGFMVLNIDTFEYVNSKTIELERDLLVRIGEDDELSFYIYDGKCQNIFTKRKMYQIN